MTYTKEQIEEFKEILEKYKKQLEEPILKEERIYTTCVNPDYWQHWCHDNTL